MVVVRGVNLYPTGVDQIVRSCGGIAEYRVEIHTERGMSELKIQVEPQDQVTASTVCADIESAFRKNYSLRVPVVAVPAGTLPRFELKARRWIRN